MKQETSEFYSYLWLRENGLPYYAGKGKRRRAFSLTHRVHPPKDHSRILIFPMQSEEEAFESEIALIGLFGRIDNGTGCLHNLTDGGEGPAGAIHPISENTKIKISNTLKGHPVSEESRQRMRDAGTGRRISDEVRKKMSISRQGRKLSEETKKKIRALNPPQRFQTGHIMSDEIRQKISLTLSGRPKSQEMRQKLSESRKKSNPAAKLSREEVIEIKGLLESGQHTQTEIAQKFGVHSVTINDISTGRTWAHV